jgi:probable F420-dependent oxidoreductase
MEAWQNLGFTAPMRLVELAVIAEAAGMQGISLPEHLVTPSRIETPNPYVTGGGAGYVPGTPFVDPFVAFGAMSSVTTQLHFLANVYVLPLRNLFVAAKSVSSAAVLSGNRVVLGVGIGWLKEEFAAVGARFTSRAARTHQMQRLRPALLTGDEVTSDSAHYAFPPLHIAPVPTHPVPIVVGGISDAALARAARADGWVGINFAEPVLMPILDRLQRAREMEGRGGPAFRVIVSRPPDFDRAMAHRYAAAGVTAIVNRPTVFAVGDEASVDAHRAAM